MMMPVTNDSGGVMRSVDCRAAPPLSFLLPCYGTASSEEFPVLSSSEQWLWYFYITAWSRPFFLLVSSKHERPLSRNSTVCSDGHMAAVSMSFEESLKLVHFPGFAAMRECEARWQTLRAVTDEVTTRVMAAAEAAAVEDNGDCLYPSLPRVTETCFGRVLRSLATRDYLSSMTSSSSWSSSMEKLVRRALTVVRKRLGRPDEDLVASAEKYVVWKGALQAILSWDAAVCASVVPHALLFDVERATPASTAAGGKDADVDVVAEAYQARLFAALAVEAFGRLKTSCARLLLAYVNQGGGVLAAARVSGVVTGVIEYAIAYHFCREDGTGRCPLTAAVLLLHTLVELQDALVREEEGMGAVTSCLLATTIVSCTQELIFALVVGGSVTPHRSPRVGQTDGSRPNNGSGEQHQRFQLQNNISVRPVVARALTLHEMDALLQTFLPALMQQVGLEWPWSESLRRCRLLDKAQQETVMMAPDGVRLGSRAVFEQLLIALGRRTYTARLRSILPQSYDSLLDAVFPVKAQNTNGNGSNEGGVSAEQQICFTMPPYYRAAGEALLEFFERSGLGSSTTADEVERVLQRNTDVQPMVVQIQALGCRSNNSNEEDSRDNNTDSAELLRTPLLSEEEKQWLLLRYRCEVLLASLIVYTQLQTVSMVQQLIRRLAPLFEKLLLPLLHRRTLSRRIVVMRRGHPAGEAGGSTTNASLIEFTPEFKLLIDDIQYGFYPLEWIPEVLDAHQRLRAVEEGDTSSSSFYSVFAAVAHHFGLVLHGSPQGLRGGEGTDYAVRAKAYRFFAALLLNNLVDAVTSSCELEGAMAVRATRRVGDRRMPNNNNNINNNAGSQYAELLLRRQRGAASFHTIVKPHDVIFTLAQCLLPIELASRPIVEAGGCRASEEWLRRVVVWGNSTSAKLTLHQQQQKCTTASAASAAASSVSLATPLVTQYNSLTFDSVPLARETIRSLRRRLSEKLHVTMTDGSASPEPLLQQHLGNLRSLLETIGLLPQCPPRGDETPSAVQLLWASPLFSRELQLNGFYTQEM